ncbi:hypothetical protein AB0H97_37615 [Streptomyces sp. NPDC050788]|jgi:hypothetical protein|uniref:hypothetical protein n=1 Tax=Streptomyces sp. NPDC050788 TaxID=3155041 RepID=UPI00343879CE
MSRSGSAGGGAAGPNQRLDAPFGDGVGWGEDLHNWLVSAQEDAAARSGGIDVDHLVRRDRNIAP